MRKLFSTLLMILPVLGFTQTGNYVIAGKIGHYNAPAKAYLIYNMADKRVSDSVVIKDGSFEFRGTIVEPTRGNLIVNPEGNGMRKPFDHLVLYIDKGTTTVTSKDSAATATVMGSKMNDDEAKFNKLIAMVNDGWRNIEAIQNAASPEVKASDAFKDQIDSLSEALETTQTTIYEQFIKENPSSMVSLNALRGLAYTEDYNEVNDMFTHLSPELRNGYTGRIFVNELDKLKLISIGHAAPEFSQPDANGNVVKLSSFRGKYVLVDFWASWCAPCRAENPNVLKAYNEFKDKNFTVLSVSLDSDKALWLKAIHQDNLPWMQVSDLKGGQNEAAQLYNVKGIPSNYLIGSDGNIVAKELRGKRLRETLARVVK